MISGSQHQDKNIDIDEVDNGISIKNQAARYRSMDFGNFALPQLILPGQLNVTQMKNYTSTSALLSQDFNGLKMSYGNVDINNGYLLTDSILIHRGEKTFDIIDVDVETRKLIEAKAKINGIDYYGMKIQINLNTNEIIVDGISIKNLAKAVFTLVLLSKRQDGNFIASLPKDLLAKLIYTIMPAGWANNYANIPITKRVIGHFFPVQPLNSQTIIASEAKQL